MNKLAVFFAALVLAVFPLMGCQSTRPGEGGTDTVSRARQALEDLPEPTFESLEVYAHDYAARGIEMLCEKHPDVRVPLRIFADSALSVLTEEQLTMLDVIALSQSLDQIEDGRVKLYLDLAWTLLEMNGVIRRDDVTATLTEREQRLLIAVFQGMYLGTDSDVAERERVLNGYGPRYGPEAEKADDNIPPAGALPPVK